MIDYGEGIYCVDSGYEHKGKAAVYILKSGERAAIFETAHGASFGRVKKALAKLGVPKENVEFIFLSHVHLDHAGGAGVYAEGLPNAQVVVHPRGARHMAAPGRLIAGAAAVYGEEAMERKYGQILPVPEDRIITPEDGGSVRFADRDIICLHTPGHAKHHASFYDEKSRALFAGDSFGLSYSGMEGKNGKWLVPTTSPVQFSPGDMLSSIDAMADLSPRAVYLTHFGAAGNVASAEVQLRSLICSLVEAAESAPRDKDGIKRAVRREILKEADRNGYVCTKEELLEVLSEDIELNTQGLLLWLEKESSKRP